MEEYSKKSSPMAKYFPDEIISRILVLLPMKLVSRFKCVSKSWNKLLTDPFFLSMHHNLHNQFLISFCRPLKFQLISFDQNLDHITHIDNLRIPDHFSPPGFTDTYDQNLITCHFLTSSNGLILSVLYHQLYPMEKKNHQFFLWNPNHTRDLINLRRLSIDRVGDSYPFHGFGYVELANDFKVVRGSEKRVLVYSLKAKSWKTIQKFPRPASSIFRMMGSFVKGRLHWIVLYNRTGMFDAKVNDIISLDLSTAKYRSVPQPQNMIIRDENNKNVLVHVGDLEGLLCAIYYSNKGNAEVWKVWLMKVYGLKESWTLLMTIPIPLSLMITDTNVTVYGVTPLRLTKKGELIMQVGERKLVKYDPTTNDFKLLFDSMFTSESFNVWRLPF